MAQTIRRRVNTVCFDLVRGVITPQSAQVLLPLIIRDTYGIADQDLYGVSLNGAFRIFVKLRSTAVYERLVEQYQDGCVDVNSAIRVRLIDVSRHYTWVKVRNVPFEADEADIRNVFERYGTVHLATAGTWVDGAYAGWPEGTFNLKMTLRHPIPSFVILDDFRTQVMVYYAGQRKTCRLCGAYDHMAAQCERQQQRQVADRRTERGPDPKAGPASGTPVKGHSSSWSEEVEREFPTVGSSPSMPVGSTVSALVEGETKLSGGERAEDVALEQLTEKFLETKRAGFDVQSVVGPEESEDERRDSQLTAGASSTGMVTVVEVAAEVHCEASPDQTMDAESVRRKRTATHSDSNDVLTPAQRPGKKPWADVLCSWRGLPG
ncbi:uncharacterized protein [Cherax quadricarinatus]|uniref:uncharacterized protein n=1 Tax=Cherax quadricarinatus TaxID=27406 RepID=UPI00387E7C96